MFYHVFQDYIAVKEKYAKYLPHSAGRYQVKRFRKAQCPIVESSEERNSKIWIDFRKSPRFSLTSPLSQVALFLLCVVSPGNNQFYSLRFDTTWA
jgi:hypothetical protein